MANGMYIGVNDKARKVKSIYLGVSGIARKVKSGYVGVNGVARQFWKSGIPISTLAVGDSVYMNVNGVSTEFLVVHQGRPSTTYHSSCDGTWLLMKDIHSKTMWEDNDGEQWVGNNYGSSDIHNYLQNTVLKQFDSAIQSKIKTVRIPYTKGMGNTGSVASGSSGLSTKLFLLSAAEVSTELTNGEDIGQTNVTYNIEGSVLDYFDCSNEPAHSTNIGYHTNRVATYNGTEHSWALRSPDTSGYTKNLEVEATVALGRGRIMAGYVYDSSGGNDGVRPALILPSTALVDDNFNVIA